MHDVFKHIITAVVTAVILGFINPFLTAPSGLSATVYPLPLYSAIPQAYLRDGVMTADINALASRLPPTDKAPPQRLLERAQLYDRLAALNRATCVNLVRIENTASKPMKDITVTAEHIVGFLYPTQGSSRTSMTPTLEPKLVLPSIDPGAAITVLAYTGLDCDNDYGGYSTVRIWNNEMTARVSTALLPKGFLITLNQWWPVTYVALASLVFLIVTGIINAIVTAASTTPPTKPADPTPTAAA